MLSRYTTDDQVFQTDESVTVVIVSALSYRNKAFLFGGDEIQIQNMLLYAVIL